MSGKTTQAPGNAEGAPEFDPAEFDSILAEVTGDDAPGARAANAQDNDDDLLGEGHEDVDDADGETDADATEADAAATSEDDGADGEGQDDNAADDPWKDAPEPLRKALQDMKAANERLEQQYRSRDGRISALTRELNQLKASKAAEQPAKPATPTGDGQGDTGNDADLTAAGEEFPEIVKPFQKALAQRDAQLAAVQQTVNTLTAGQQRDLANTYASNAAEVERAHPGFIDFIKENHEAWLVWVDDQKRDFRDMAARNDEHMTDPQGAITLLTAFKEHLGIAQDTGAPEDGDETQQQQATAEAAAINARRSRQLRGGVSVRSGKQAGTSGIPRDAGPEYFDQILADVSRDLNA